MLVLPTFITLEAIFYGHQNSDGLIVLPASDYSHETGAYKTDDTESLL